MVEVSHSRTPHRKGLHTAHVAPTQAPVREAPACSQFAVSLQGCSKDRTAWRCNMKPDCYHAANDVDHRKKTAKLSSNSKVARSICNVENSLTEFKLQVLHQVFRAFNVEEVVVTRVVR